MLLTPPEGALVRLPDDPKVEALAEAYLVVGVVTGRALPCNAPAS